MRRHGPVIAHCTDSEDFPNNIFYVLGGCSSQGQIATAYIRYYDTIVNLLWQDITIAL